MSTSELYHIALNQWIELPNMRNGRMFHSSCGFNDRAVYVFFGFNQTKVNTIERFDLDQRDWAIINTNYLSLRHTNFYVEVAQKDRETILMLGGYDAQCHFKYVFHAERAMIYPLRNDTLNGSLQHLVYHNKTNTLLGVLKPELRQNISGTQSTTSLSEDSIQDSP